MESSWKRVKIYEEKMGKKGIIWKIEKEGEWEKLKKK